MGRRRLTLLAAALAVVAAPSLPFVQAEEGSAFDVSPAVCGPHDTPETGIQGDIPVEDQDSGRVDDGYNCGLSLVGELDTVSGAVQGYGDCAYVRGDETIAVVDVSDPSQPTRVGELPIIDRTETMRVVVAEDRVVLVDGAAVYEISDCLNPEFKGEIPYPGVLPWPADLNHDVRVTFDGKAVWGAISVIEADISNLDDPSSWTVENHTCAVAAQWHPLHSVPAAAGIDLCGPDSPWQDWPPQIGHGPALNADGSRLYMGNQTAQSSMYADEDGVEDDAVRIIDTTTEPPTVLAKIDGPGHSIDWFTVDGREYLLHANEIVFQPASSCVPHPRPSSLGWAHEAFITDVTGDEPDRVAIIELAINEPEHCQAKLDSGQNTQIAYHTVDDFHDATFAMVSMGDAGLRIFDIRDPESPSEAAYFNRGALPHAGIAHVDADRGLLYVPGTDALRVLEIQPQVLAALGLPEPTDPAYPRYEHGRPATP